jgi:hypothetical protein
MERQNFYDRPMNKRRVFALLAALVTASALQATDWSRYQARTLRDMMKAAAAQKPREEAGVMAGFDDELPSKVRVTYMGKSRPVSAARRRTFNQIREMLEMRVDLPELFQNELLFREVDKEYWLAVQEPTRKHYGMELKPGSAVDIFVILLAAEKDEKGNIEPIFVVNTFDLPATSKSPETPRR